MCERSNLGCGRALRDKEAREVRAADEDAAPDPPPNALTDAPLSASTDDDRSLAVAAAEEEENA